MNFSREENRTQRQELAKGLSSRGYEIASTDIAVHARRHCF